MRGRFRIFEILMVMRMMNGGKHPLPFSTEGTHWLIRPWVVVWLVFKNRKEIKKAAHSTGTKPQARRPKQTNPVQRKLNGGREAEPRNLPPKITYL